MMGRSILLVQPDSSNCYSWERMLSANGFHVTTAHAGRESIQKTAEIGPDLVLLHTALPDLPPFEVARQIKQDARNRFVMVALVTAEVTMKEQAFVVETGIDEVLSESLSPPERIDCIKDWMNLRNRVSEQSEQVLLSMARCIEAKDPGTEGHCERISAYSARLADLLGLAAEQRQALVVGGILHDLGKVAVPDSILLKPGPLSEDEFAVIKQHPLIGEQICAPMKSFRSVLPIIRHHHERMNGSGYPDGLSGEHIPLPARILQVVDVYDALTTDRPYRPAVAPERALAIMRDETRQGWLDGSLVDSLAKLANSLEADARFIELCFAPSRLRPEVRTARDFVAGLPEHDLGAVWKYVNDRARAQATAASRCVGVNVRLRPDAPAYR
jgi:putative two-component system response regulator